ncbi:MAG: MATE family efflux transporter [Lachnospiraceae bacterium]|nr:MATE family efflux transporter [Lachnospiraceae bacterium]
MNMYNKKNAYFSRIMAIALPIIISSLISQVQMLIDKIFLGRLDITCMSAVGNASSPIWTSMNTIFTLSVGANILASQAIGAGDDRRARKVLAALYRFNNVLAAFWFLFWLLGSPVVFRLMGVGPDVIDMSISYARIFSPILLITGLSSAMACTLQVNERTRFLVVYGLVRSGLNVVLDYLLIFGRCGLPAMGVSGAALATTLAEFAGVVVALVYVCREKTFRVKPSLKEIAGAEFPVYFQSMKLGVPYAVEDFAWNLGNLFLIVMLNRVSQVAAGIYTIVFSVELLPICVFGGLGQATTTLSGQEAGARNPRGIQRIVGLSMRVCMILSAVILAFFMIFPEPIMGCFTADQSIIAASVGYLMIVGVDLFPKAGNIVIGAGIRGFGDTLWMLKTQLVGTVFVIAGSAVLVLGMGCGMTALFWLIVADEGFRSLLNYWRLRRVAV